MKQKLLLLYSIQDKILIFLPKKTETPLFSPLALAYAVDTGVRVL
jgi:hypothetical protein